jgi:hypothetical protein
MYESIRIFRDCSPEFYLLHLNFYMKFFDHLSYSILQKTYKVRPILLSTC